MKDYRKFSKGLPPEEYGVLPRSVHELGETLVFIAKDGEREVLVTKNGEELNVMEENHEAALFLRKNFCFTAPSRVLGKPATVGVGDRLGLACPGHLRVFEDYDVYPILAQQSIRELNLTNRNYDDVLDCVTFSVFRADFQREWGADGDHLKTPKEIEYALGCGYTMITLDCSEKIHNDAARLKEAEVSAAYRQNPELEALYLGRTVDVGEGVSLTFNESDFKRMTLIYGEAVDYIVEIYGRYMKDAKADFEISIDETESVTTPLQHYFVANELVRRGVVFQTMAPRFIGEFQKGIDYIGDLDEFDRDFSVHCAIAEHFGYKISVHSGSDKFSVFPSIGRNTKHHFHIKTAGTNWLEAAKLVALKDPALYRELHKFALSAFPEATKYYHVTTNLANIPDVETLSDKELPDLFANNDARQLIHITYGLILNAKDGDGNRIFYERLYSLWNRYAADYSDLIYAHICHHLAMLFK